MPAAVEQSPYWDYGSQTVISEVDVSNPAAMAVTQTMTVEGQLRRRAPERRRAPGSSSPRRRTRSSSRSSRVPSSGWVPTWRFDNRRTGRQFTRTVASCNQITRPVQFSGLGMLSIITVDFDRGLQDAQSTSLMADAQIVYGSTSNLYIATQQWLDPELPRRCSCRRPRRR